MRSWTTGVLLALLWLWPLAAIRVVNGTSSTVPVVVQGFQGTSTPALFVTAGETHELLVVAHGGLTNRTSMMAFCYEANARGADCLSLDLLGHGASKGYITDFREPGCAETRGVLHDALEDARILGVQGRHYSKIGYVGHSLGAALLCEMGTNNAAYVGQFCAANPGRVVRAPSELELPFGKYNLPPAVSHVLEPWTPVVIDRAVNVTMGSLSRTGGPRQQLTALLPLVSLVGGFMFATWLASRIVEGINDVEMPVPQWRQVIGGIFAGEVFIVVFAVCGFRTMWFPGPVQGSDAALFGAAVIPAFALFGVWRVFWAQAELFMNKWPATRVFSGFIDGVVALVCGIGPALGVAFDLSKRWAAGGWCPGPEVLSALPISIAFLMIPVACFGLQRSVMHQTEWPSWTNLGLSAVCGGYALALLTPAFPANLFMSLLGLV